MTSPLPLTLHGILLRDQFAGLAMQSLITKLTRIEMDMAGRNAVAAEAYRFAQAMITARDQADPGVNVPPAPQRPEGDLTPREW